MFGLSSCVPHMHDSPWASGDIFFPESYVYMRPWSSLFVIRALPVQVWGSQRQDFGQHGEKTNRGIHVTRVPNANINLWDSTSDIKNLWVSLLMDYKWMAYWDYYIAQLRFAVLLTWGNGNQGFNCGKIAYILALFFHSSSKKACHIESFLIWYQMLGHCACIEDSGGGSPRVQQDLDLF